MWQWQWQWPWHGAIMSSHPEPSMNMEQDSQYILYTIMTIICYVPPIPIPPQNYKPETVKAAHASIVVISMEIITKPRMNGKSENQQRQLATKINGRSTGQQKKKKMTEPSSKNSPGMLWLLWYKKKN